MANVNIEILAPPVVDPINLTDMKTYLRVDYTDEDSLITQLIDDAREYAEEITRKALAPQTIRATIQPDTVPEGTLSGPVGGDADIYELNERMTTVPFGFYGPILELPRPPISQVSIVEYQLTPLDGQPSPTMVWTSLPQFDVNGYAQWLLDTNTNPHTLKIAPLIVATRFRITYYAGYGSNNDYTPGPVPNSIINPMKSLVSFWFDNRQGQPIPDSITAMFARKRIFRL